MIVKKLTITDKDLVEKCDRLFLKFLDSEGKYDDNYLKREHVNSFINDLADQNNILLAATDTDVVFGFLFGFIEKKKNGKLPIAHLSFVYIDESHRNKKIATNLINTFLLELKSMNIEIIEVKCFENNEIAKNLYNKFGFNVLWSNYRKKI